MFGLFKKHRTMTIDEFMPLWTEAQVISHSKGVKAKARFERKHKLDITESTCCMIGEAHRRIDRDYAGCAKCKFYSFGYMSKHDISPAIKADGDLEKFYKFKKEAYEHFKEEHSELLRI